MPLTDAAGQHRHRLGQRDAGPRRGLQEREERLLLGVVGQRRVAGRGTDPLVPPGDQVGVRERLVGARSPTARAGPSRGAAPRTPRPAGRRAPSRGWRGSRRGQPRTRGRSRRRRGRPSPRTRRRNPGRPSRAARRGPRPPCWAGRAASAAAGAGSAGRHKPGAVRGRVQLDVVADRVRRPEAHHGARPQRAAPPRAFEEGLARPRGESAPGCPTRASSRISG